MEALADSSWHAAVALVALALLVISCFFESNDPLRYHAKYVLYAVYSSIVAVLMLPYVLLSPKNVKNARDASILLRCYTKLLGIEWDIRGTEELGNERGCVVVANHQSVLDILGMFVMWRVMGKCAAVARNAIFYVFPFGPIAWLAGVVFISRNNGKKSMKQLNETSELLRNQATKLFIFPEGTRNKNILKNGLQPFKAGAFRMAIENQVPILPIVYSPYYFIDGRIRFFGHGKIIVQTLEAIPTAGLGKEDIGDLIHKTRRLMQEEFEKLATEVLATLPRDYPANVAQRAEFAKSKHTRIVTRSPRDEH